MRVPGHQSKSYAWRWTAALAGLAVLTFALVMALVVTPASEVQAASFTVNRTGDDVDANIGDGKCDADLGTTGYQCTLRAAIQEVNALGGTNTITTTISGGGTIELGTVLPIITDDNLTLRGQANVTIEIGGALNFTGLAVDANGVTLRDLHFDGNGSTGAGLVFATSADDNTITNVYIEDFGGGGIYFTDNNDRNTITGSHLEDNGSTPADDGIIFAGTNSDDNVIQTTTIENSGGDGIHAAGTNSDDLTIQNNTITENGDDGIDLANQKDYIVTGNSITDNIDYGLYADPGQGGQITANTIQANRDGGINLQSQDDLDVDSNWVINNGNAADENQIEVGGGTTGTIDLTRNYIQVGTLTDGIQFDTGCTCVNVRINAQSTSLANLFRGTITPATHQYYAENFSGTDIAGTYNDWNDYADPSDKICADNATVDAACDVGKGNSGDIVFSPFLTSSGVGPITPTPTASITPTITLTPTPGTPTATSTPTRTATPIFTLTPTAVPMESVALVGGTCNPVASTYPDDTAIATIANAVSPSGILISIWWFDTAGGRWLGYSPQFPQASDLSSVDRLEAIFICVSSAGTWSRHLI